MAKDKSTKYHTDGVGTVVLAGSESAVLVDTRWCRVDTCGRYAGRAGGSASVVSFPPNCSLSTHAAYGV